MKVPSIEKKEGLWYTGSQGVRAVSLLKKIRFTHRKTFSAWQIELTTRCLLRCAMCVKEAASTGVRRDMDFDDFSKIAPYFRKVKRIVLEGWGESLLYPRLCDCIRLVKREGAEAGFVTSGTGLNATCSAALLEAGLDFIGFSFSGATAETHNAIRQGSDFDALVESIRILQSDQKSRGMKGPRMHIVYLMLRNNVEETPAIVDLAKKLDIRKVALVHAILIASPDQERQRVFAEGAADERFEAVLKVAAARAASAGIDLIVPPLSPTEAGVCGEDPLQNLYISVDGEVSPCVYLYPPVASPFTRIHFGQKHSLEKLSFGNIFKQPFPEIWNGRAYTDFRKCFQDRQTVTRAARQASFGLDPGAAAETMKEMPQAPASCRTCHKLAGF